jgi:hypothetical protein
MIFIFTIPATPPANGVVTDRIAIKLNNFEAELSLPKDPGRENGARPLRRGSSADIIENIFSKNFDFFRKT